MYSIINTPQVEIYYFLMLTETDLLLLATAFFFKKRLKIPIMR